MEHEAGFKVPVPSGPARVALGRGPSERFGWGLPWGAPGCSGPSLGGLGTASGEGASGLFGKSFPTPEASMETDELRGLLTASWGLRRSKGQLELRPRSQRPSSTWDKGSDRAYGGPGLCLGRGPAWASRVGRGQAGVKGVGKGHSFGPRGLTEGLFRVAGRRWLHRVCPRAVCPKSSLPWRA